MKIIVINGSRRRMGCAHQITECLDRVAAFMIRHPLMKTYERLIFSKIMAGPPLMEPECH